MLVPPAHLSLSADDWPHRGRSRNGIDERAPERGVARVGIRSDSLNVGARLRRVVAPRTVIERSFADQGCRPSSVDLTETYVMTDRPWTGPRRHQKQLGVARRLGTVLVLASQPAAAGRVNIDVHSSTTAARSQTHRSSARRRPVTRLGDAVPRVGQPTRRVWAPGLRLRPGHFISRPCLLMPASMAAALRSRGAPWLRAAECHTDGDVHELPTTTVLVVDDEHSLRYATHRSVQPGNNVLLRDRERKRFRICTDTRRLDLVLTDIYLTAWRGQICRSHSRDQPTSSPLRLATVPRSS